MKKITLLMVLTMSFVFAEVEYFGGISLGKGIINYDLKLTKDSDGSVLSKSSKVTNGTAITASIGAIANEAHKVLVAYSKYNSVSAVDVSLMTVSYDYLVTGLSSKWTPFLGTSLGVMKWTEETKSSGGLIWDSSKISFNTTIVSGRIGADYRIDKTSFLTFAYSKGLLVNGSVDSGFSVGGTSYTANIDIIEAKQVGITYNVGF